MTHPVFDPHNDVSLGIAISAQNDRLAMSNADLRGVEPEMKSTIVGFTPDGAPIWRRIPVTRVRINQGWVETRLNELEVRDGDGPSNAAA